MTDKHPLPRHPARPSTSAHQPGDACIRCMPVETPATALAPRELKCFRYPGSLLPPDVWRHCSAALPASLRSAPSGTSQTGKRRETARRRDYPAGVLHPRTSYYPPSNCTVINGYWLHRKIRLCGADVKITSDDEPNRRYFRSGAFSDGGSKGSAWSFPFCFSKISTLPSASSNCLRHVAESCMPSSNSVKDLSKGTSAFSSSWTIFSSR